MTLRHAVTALGLALAGLLTPASRAEAGGSWPSPVHDRYEPGQLVEIVGYTGIAPTSEYYGWLRVDPDEAHRPRPAPAWPVWPFVHPTDLRLGAVAVERTHHGGWAAWRVSLSFPLPADLKPGAYEVVICNDPCTEGLGDVVGAVVNVGVDPESAPVRDWPMDEPAIARLAPDALLWYMNGTATSQTVTAAQVWAGDLPAPVKVRPQLDDIVDADINDVATTAAPIAPDEEDADVRLTEGDRDRDRSQLPTATPWVGALAGAAALFVAVRALGPGRKHVHGGHDAPLASAGGQTARRAARWPRRVVRS